MYIYMSIYLIYIVTRERCLETIPVCCSWRKSASNSWWFFMFGRAGLSYAASPSNLSWWLHLLRSSEESNLERSAPSPQSSSTLVLCCEVLAGPWQSPHVSKLGLSHKSAIVVVFDRKRLDTGCDCCAGDSNCLLCLIPPGRWDVYDHSMTLDWSSLNSYSSYGHCFHCFDPATWMNYR